MRLTLNWCGLLLLAAVAADADDHPAAMESGHRFHHLTGDPFHAHLHAMVESHYVSEGRDNLGGDGLLGMTLELGWHDLTFGAWLAESPGTDYDEVNLSLAWAKEIGNWEVYFGYTHLRFPADEAHDHELGGGIAWSGLPLDLTASLDAWYSFDSAGSFWELSLAADYEITDRFSLEPSLIFGMNQGYVADGHDGANHVAVGLAAQYALTESLELEVYLAHTWAIDRQPLTRPGDVTLDSFLYGGVGIGFEF